ncbi:MAG TPA: 23S rRNA (adenine(2503)-C(2))-methyltransferase RlmN [Gemmatimonadota bacterium]|nr:23S rRNA (adenine(2503)-C(2))-methyltransferase RlmN [Gemmatimonadota bacterium]
MAVGSVNGKMSGGGRRIDRLVALDPRPEVLSFGPDALRANLGRWLDERREPGFRLEQIVHGLYRQHAVGWSAMSALPKELRSELERAFRLPSVTFDEERESADGTRKLLWRLIDGEAVESVLIPTPSRDTLCISSQAGCALRCAFCATGMFGFRRDLTAGEIVDQVRQLVGRRGQAGYGVNVVFMGMGEPLLNWENLATALDTLIDARGLDIGARRITVSTVGVPDRIVALGERFPQVRLAVSLHAAVDGVRNEIVPLNRRYPLRQLLAACRLWAESTGKRLSFEVLHLPGVNDRPEDVAALARVLHEVPAKVNLMRYNPVPGAPYRRPAVAETVAFRDAILQRAGHSPGHPPSGPPGRSRSGATVTVRRSRGMDIEAACGQLRLARAGNKGEPEE